MACKLFTHIRENSYTRDLFLRYTTTTMPLDLRTSKVSLASEIAGKCPENLIKSRARLEQRDDACAEKQPMTRITVHRFARVREEAPVALETSKKPDSPWPRSRLVGAWRIHHIHGRRKFHTGNVATWRIGGSRTEAREGERERGKEDGTGGLAGVYLAIEGSDKPRRQCEPSIVGATESGTEGSSRTTRRSCRRAKEAKRRRKRER